MLLATIYTFNENCTMPDQLPRKSALDSGHFNRSAHLIIMTVFLLRFTYRPLFHGHLPLMCVLDEQPLRTEGLRTEGLRYGLECVVVLLLHGALEVLSHRD